MRFQAQAALVLVILLTASLAAVAQNETPEELAASGDLRVMLRRFTPDERLRVWVESGGKRADLPPSPVALEGDSEGDTWSLLVPPSLALSPNARWLFATQKVCTGYAIGYLYRRGESLDFRLATKTRFDALAWRFFAKTEGVEVEELIASDSPAHLIDFVAFSDRYLGVALRGAVENVSRNPENTRGETGIYDWQCLYDLEAGAFVVPEVMKVHNRGAWKRWAGGDNDSWDKDAGNELEAAFRALMSKLDAPAQEKLKKDEQVWLEQCDEKKKSAPDYDSFDETRRRAVELQIRAMHSLR